MVAKSVFNLDTESQIMLGAVTRHGGLLQWGRIVSIAVVIGDHLYPLSGVENIIAIFIVGMAVDHVNHFIACFSL